MDDSALKAALRKLLAHGEAAEDNKMKKFAAAKKAPVAAPCAECALLEDGEQCEKCAGSPVEDEGELAGLLEQGAAEA